LPDTAETPHLKRALGAFAITVYAVGDVLGAGIYALVGKVVAEAGSMAWLSFLLSALTAFFTGLTYAELSSRFPYAGGAAAYCKRAFPHPLVAFSIGFLVLASGVASAATISLAMVGYLDPFLQVPPWAGSIGLLLLLSWLNHRGIEESAHVNLVLTAIEVCGLLLIVGVGLYYAGTLMPDEAVVQPPPNVGWTAIVGGATVAFFAYIGFEDTANVAEEVRDASRVLPRAILAAIAISCVLYVAVTLAALAVVPVDVLARSPAPLLEVLKAADIALPGNTFSLIALVAICNTGLLNLIMASRLMFGMAHEGLLPAGLGRVHAKRRSPWVAVWVAFALAVVFALSGGVELLAKTTSLLLLLVFTVLHVGLLRVKRLQPTVEDGVFQVPRWIPVVGVVVSATMALQYPVEAYVRAAFVLVGAGIFYLAMPVERNEQ
jgi:amino acid transporter